MLGGLGCERPLPHHVRYAESDTLSWQYCFQSYDYATVLMA